MTRDGGGHSEESMLTVRLPNTRASATLGKDRERLLALHLHCWDKSQLYFSHFVSMSCGKSIPVGHWKVGARIPPDMTEEMTKECRFSNV